ncbi:MAG: hypothetical protein U0694_03560 [Anaerolineae bacterium]
MSNDELYEIARKRIDRRNRLLAGLGVHGAALTAYVGAFIMLANTAYAEMAVAVLVAWGGLFVLHCILFGMAWSREDDIRGEVAKLRKAMDYEKPKRLALAEDGELVDFEQDGAAKTTLQRGS